MSAACVNVLKYGIGLVAQLVRALHSHCKGRRFESFRVHLQRIISFFIAVETYLQIRNKIGLTKCGLGVLNFIEGKWKIEVFKRHFPLD